MNTGRSWAVVCPGIRAGARCRYRLTSADRFGICWHCWQALPDATARALLAGGPDARLQLQQALTDLTPLEQIEVT
jgi:hypothetical protein